MSILNYLSKLGALAALTVSIVAFPAIAQHHGGGHKSFVKGHHGSSFHGNRGFNGRSGFRGHNGRGFNNGFRGHNGRGFNNGFRGHNGRGFNNGFRGHNGRGFNNGFKGFNNRGFNNGFKGFNNHGFHNNGFRGNRFNGGFNNNVIIKAPVQAAYSVGGFYGVHSNTVIISNFGAHGLYAPPRGYQWVCDKGSKDAVLAAIATGAIIAIAADTLATPY